MTKRFRKCQVIVIANWKNTPQVLRLMTHGKRGEFWQNVTGTVEDNERYSQGAARELLEETSLVASDLKKLECVFEFKDRWEHSVREKCFLALIGPGTSTPGVGLSKEHKDYQWLELNKVQADTFHFLSNYQCFLSAKQKLQELGLLNTI